MNRLALLLGFLTLFLSIFTPHVVASEYYERDYRVTYNVKDTGVTNVSLQVTLTNKSSDYYAVSDTLTVSFADIENVTVKDPDGAIKPIITKTDAGNDIESTFNKKAVGIGKSLVYSISFDTTNIARRTGKIWEINIPGLSNPDVVDLFDVEVKVPESFGKPSYIKPARADQKLLFNKDDLAKSSISLAYGNEQIYAFDLSYHLQNKNVFPIKTEIALPPSTNYQEVALESIIPKPLNVVMDQDGNWLAQYQLSPAQRLDVTALGSIKLLASPARETLSPSEYALYTKEQPFWEVTNLQIKELAKNLKTPKAIYEYVVSNLNYNFNRVGIDNPRLGAVGVLGQKNAAVCLEFTDLFIALSRAAGIPAREVNGHAHTENTKQRPLSLVADILHAWPEYYDKDKQMWVMIDPTWGNTTGGTDYFSVFDYDHIVFIKKGVNSQYPIPAGGYKLKGDENKKDIMVEFASVFTTEIPQIAISSDFPTIVLSALPVSGSFTLANTGTTLFPKKSAVLLAKELLPLRQELVIPSIPPYGHVKLPVGFKKTSFFTDKSYDFTFNVQDSIIHKRVKVTPFAFTTQQIIGGVIGVIFTISVLIITIKTRGLHLFRRK